MGQCMEQIATGSKLHPQLGRLQLHQHKGKNVLKLTQAISDEEHYIEWSKRIDKLKYSNELKEHIYLPLGEEYKKPTNLCQAANHLELFLQPYEETLKQSLDNNARNKKYPTAYLLWSLMVTLLKYIKHCEEKNEGIQNVNFHNILVFRNSKVKIVPKYLLYGFGIRPLN